MRAAPLLLLLVRLPSTSALSISNGVVTASFSAAGALTSLSSGGVFLSVSSESFALELDGTLVNSSSLAAPVVTPLSGSALRVDWSAPPYSIAVSWTAAPGAPGLRKGLSVSRAGAASLTVGAAWPVDSLRATAASARAGAAYPSGALGVYGVFARFADGSGAAVAAENPFQTPSATPGGGASDVVLRTGYIANMTWNLSTAMMPSPAPWLADGVWLCLYSLSSAWVPPAVVARAADDPARFRPARPYAAGAGAAAVGGPVAHATDTNTGSAVEYVAFGAAAVTATDPSWLNAAERDVYRAIGEATVVLSPGKCRTVHIP